MSASSYLSYQPSAFLPARDPPEYNMQMALDLKPISSYLSDPFMLESFQNRLMHEQSMAPPPPEPQHHFAYPQMQAPLGALQHPASSMSIYDVRRTHELRQPAPVRPVSTTQLYSSADAMDAGRLSYETQPSSYSSAPISDPSPMFVEPSTSAPTHQTQPPPPAPSWAMSGSLDPATGIYQSAPEHPRVRTAQACDKCRSRKAKCSGDHPACERCRLRGLRCEYAPERKMRGPNKVKRKPVPKEQRRMSVASSSSRSSSSRPASRSRSTKPPFTTVPLTLHGQPSDDSDGVSPPPEAAAALPADSQASAAETLRAGQPRPTHIDLSGIAAAAMQIPLENTVEQHPYPEPHRRSSLPSQLVEAYTGRLADQTIYTPPRGIEVFDAHARPHSNPLFHQQAISPMRDTLTGWPPMYSNASDTSSSDPATPLSLYEEELMYPLEYHPAPNVAQGEVDFSAFDHHYVDNSYLTQHHDWSSSPFDNTPTGCVDDHEKNYQ